VLVSFVELMFLAKGATTDEWFWDRDSGLMRWRRGCACSDQVRPYPFGLTQKECAAALSQALSYRYITLIEVKQMEQQAIQANNPPDASPWTASAMRAASAITGIASHADVAALKNAQDSEHAREQICAAMWRLRGMRDATLQLAKWNEAYKVAIVPRDYVTRLDRAAAECAESIRSIGSDHSVQIPIPEWKDYHPEVARKKNGKKNGRAR
jgi:hypothetical protein